MQRPPAHGFPSPTFCVSGGVSARSLTSPASPVAPSRTVASWAQSCSMLSKFQAYLSTKVKGCVQWPKHLRKQKKKKRTSCPGLSVQSAVPGTSGILLLTSADSTSAGCVASGTPSGVVSTSLELGITFAAAGSSRCSCHQKSPLPDL